MSLLQASNFKVTMRPEKPAVSVLFKPTGRRYIYTAVLIERRDRGAAVLPRAFASIATGSNSAATTTRKFNDRPGS